MCMRLAFHFRDLRGFFAWVILPVVMQWSFIAEILLSWRLRKCRKNMTLGGLWRTRSCGLFCMCVCCRLLPREFNSYGSRVGNFEVMLRGAFAHKHLVNLMMRSGKPSPKTFYLPTREEVSTNALHSSPLLHFFLFPA